MSMIKQNYGTIVNVQSPAAHIGWGYVQYTAMFIPLKILTGPEGVQLHILVVVGLFEDSQNASALICPRHR